MAAIGNANASEADAAVHNNCYFDHYHKTSFYYTIALYCFALCYIR